MDRKNFYLAYGIRHKDVIYNYRYEDSKIFLDQDGNVAFFLTANPDDIITEGDDSIIISFNKEKYGKYNIVYKGNYIISDLVWAYYEGDKIVGVIRTNDKKGHPIYMSVRIGENITEKFMSKKQKGIGILINNFDNKEDDNIDIQLYTKLDKYVHNGRTLKIASSIDIRYNELYGIIRKDCVQPSFDIGINIYSAHFYIYKSGDFYTLVGTDNKTNIIRPLYSSNSFDRVVQYYNILCLLEGRSFYMIKKLTDTSYKVEYPSERYIILEKRDFLPDIIEIKEAHELI